MNNQNKWKCNIFVSIRNHESYYEDLMDDCEISANTKEEVLSDISNVLFNILELNRIGTNNVLCVNYTIELNNEYEDHEEFFMKPEIIYTSEPSKLINWGEHTKGLPIIYSIDREKSKLNILISED